MLICAYESQTEGEGSHQQSVIACIATRVHTYSIMRAHAHTLCTHTHTHTHTHTPFSTPQMPTRREILPNTYPSNTNTHPSNANTQRNTPQHIPLKRQHTPLKHQHMPLKHPPPAPFPC